MCGLARVPNQHLCHTSSLIQSINYPIHLLNKDLQTNSTPGTFLGTRDTAGKRWHMSMPSWSLDLGWGGKGVSSPKYVTCKQPLEMVLDEWRAPWTTTCPLFLWILQYGNTYKLPVGCMISELTGTGHIESIPFCCRGGNGAPKECDLAKSPQSL